MTVGSTRAGSTVALAPATSLPSELAYHADYEIVRELGQATPADKVAGRAEQI